MALLFVDGFGQFRGQVGSQLLTSLTTAGYEVSQGVALTNGRHPGSYALELQVSAGAAGSTWSRRDNGVKSNLRDVAYGGGLWVAVGENGVIYVSPDTLTWVPCVSPTSTTLVSVAYGGGLWVAVGGQSNNSTVILTSTDGQNWTLRTSPVSNANLVGVAYGDDLWLAVGNGPSNTPVILASSDDGVTWGVVTGATTAPINGVMYHEDFGWLTWGNQGQVQLSDDGLNWTLGSYGATGNIASVAYDGNTLLAVAGFSFRRSNDGGETWQSAGALPNTITIAALGTAGGLWVAVGSNTGGTAVIYTSTDLENWTSQSSSGARALASIAVSPAPNVAWVAVGAVVGNSPNQMASVVVSLAPPTTVGRTFRSAANRVVLGFAHKATARGLIASIEGLCDINWPAGIEILGQTGNAVPIRNVWYYYELTVDKTSGVIRLHINDTADIEVPLPAGAEGMTEYKVTWQVENGAVGYLGDIYWLDSTSTNGSTLTNRLKPIRVPIRFPTEDVLTEWSSTDDGAHWAVVGTTPPDSNRYIYSNQSGAQDLFLSDDPLPAGAGGPDMPIIAVGVVVAASKSDLDNRQIGMVVGQGEDQLEVVESELSIDPKYCYAVFETAPGGGGWDETDVQSTPFGVVVRP